MAVNIYSKRLGINRCYVIKERGCVMIDAGPPRSEQAIEDLLKAIAIRPDEIQLIVLTHGHADHVGSVLGVSRSLVRKSPSTNVTVIPLKAVHWSGLEL